jgi:SNF2 family DNA or RNA helicase
VLLNAKYFGAGLNLQFTDEIIIYHRMSKDLETQVIGRAQRLGRTESLKINYLCYDNEYSE